MKRGLFSVLLLVTGVAAGMLLDRFLVGNDGARDDTAVESALVHAAKHLDPDYVCPMHAEVVASEQGTCPICGMQLVKKATGNTLDSNDAAVVTVASTVINNLGVRVAPVERKTLIKKIETPGFIQQTRKDSYTTFKSPASGKLGKFHVAQDAWLEKGDAIVDIELNDLVPVQEKHLELLKTGNEELPQDDVTAAQHDQQDGEQLAGKDNKLTTATTRLLMKKAGMTDEDIGRLEKTGKTSPVITLYAGHQGRIQELRVAEGDVLTANQYLFSLGGLMRVTVFANAFQRDASWVRPGQGVDITIPNLPGKIWKGTVSSGAVSINTNSQNIGVKLAFNAPADVVRNGMYVVGSIYGNVSEDVLSVPRDAVIYTQDENRVVLVEGRGKFRPVPVKLGVRAGNDIEIVEGLEEGDVIVVSGQFLIDSESSLQASYRRLTAVR